MLESWKSNPFGWFFANLLEAYPNFFNAITHPSSWLAWMADPGFEKEGTRESLVNFIYYGASVELFFVLLNIFLILTIIGIARPGFMWGIVRGLEAFGNTIGRTAAWAALIMVLVQILIIFMQGVFAASQIGVGFGYVANFDVSWWSESLKFYNAILVTLCVSYTFIQGGHVRVDLFYAPAKYRTKKIIDMFGSMVFMIPPMIVIWIYSWFFFWRSMMSPPFSATNSLEQLAPRARGIRWNVETTGFSPNGFNGYFLFKILILMFVVLVVLQAVAFFYRSYRELREGPESEGKYLDRDPVTDPLDQVAQDVL